MHPSYRAKYGFKDEDEPYIQAFESWGELQGWSGQQIDNAFLFYREHYREGVTYDALKASWMDYASRRGMTPDQATAADHFIRSATINGPQSFIPMSNRGDDARFTEQVEHMIKHDPDRYNADKELQLRFYNAIERLNGGEESGPKQAAPPPTTATYRRIQEMEAMLKDPKSDYFVGVQAKELQAEYRQLLAGDTPNATADRVEPDRPASGLDDVNRRLFGQ